MNSRYIIFLFFTIIAFHAGVAFGQTNTPVGPTNPRTQEIADPGVSVNRFYQFALSIAGILAFGAVAYGGIRYTFAAGNPSGQSEGKEWVKSALWGLLLLGGAYLILNTISHDIVSLNITTP